jgi:LuxR family maltose regulon positive regulatory protein
MDSPLLRTKLYMPPLRTGFVRRPRLIERLNAGLSLGHKLTLISAPAGFGKTTLLCEWISPVMSSQQPATNDREARARRMQHAVRNAQSGDQASPHIPCSSLPTPSFSWLSLDKGDNDPTRFVTYLVAALQTVQQDIGESLLSRQRAPQAPSLRESLAAVINEVSALADRLVLVLDDYQTIKAKSIHDAVAFFLDRLPGNVHLVITTRSDPVLPLARLRGRGQLTELRQADLRFTSEEVSAFLSQTMGLALSPDQVVAVASRTEGWIAGLQMAAISMQGRRDLTGFIQELTGSHRFILDYLTEEVLDQQPEAIQEFLLQTSILERLTAPLCGAILGSENGECYLAQNGAAWEEKRGSEGSGFQEILESLERANLFLVPLDDRREWYRYHRLFADLLRRRLHRSRPDLVPILHGRASAWYERRAQDLGQTRQGNGLMSAAIDHALSAGDAEYAAHLVLEIADSIMLRSEFATLQRWIETLPGDVVRTHPLLCVYHAVVLLIGGQPLEAAEARIQDALAADDNGTVTGEIAAFYALLATYRQDVQQSTELSERALELLPADRLFFRSFVAVFLGLNYMFGGDVAAAIRAFDETARIGQQAGNLVITVLSLTHLAELAHIQGELGRATALYERALQTATDERGRPKPIAGLALIGLGQVARERGELERATRYYTEGNDLVVRWGKVATINGYLGLARVRQSQGDVAGAQEAIRAAEQIAQAFDAMQVDDTFVAAHKARLHLAQGNVEAVQQWLEERGLAQDIDALDDQAGSADPSFLRVVEYMILAEVYIAQGRGKDALGLLAPLLRVSEAARWTTITIKLLSLEALAYQAEQDVNRAIASLTRALVLAEPGGFVQTFVKAGKPMESLLRAVCGSPSASSRAVSRDLSHRGDPGPSTVDRRRSAIGGEYVQRLLAAFHASRPPAQQSCPEPETLFESLSDREQQVLRLLNTHLSSTEIAEELYLSVNTVRSHIKNIYSKLDVHGRAEAIARAAALGLL